MKYGFVCLLLLGLALLVSAQEPTLSPLKAQFYDQMLAQFNDMNVVPGILMVSFQADVTIDVAEDILQLHGLTIWNHQTCQTFSSYNEAGTLETFQDCYFVTEWDNNAKIATIQVPVGEEKIFAQELYAEEKVDFVEPDIQYVPEVDETIFPPEITITPTLTTPTPSNSIMDSPYFVYGVAILFIIGLILVWRTVRRHA